MFTGKNSIRSLLLDKLNIFRNRVVLQLQAEGMNFLWRGISDEQFDVYDIELFQKSYGTYF